MDTNYKAKYLWSSDHFDRWVKEQQKKLKENGFNISTAGVTHKLCIEVLTPNKIDLSFPQMQLKKRGKR